jgi:hypothetical protein
MALPAGADDFRIPEQAVRASTAAKYSRKSRTQLSGTHVAGRNQRGGGGHQLRHRIKHHPSRCCLHQVGLTPDRRRGPIEPRPGPGACGGPRPASVGETAPLTRLRKRPADAASRHFSLHVRAARSARAALRSVNAVNQRIPPPVGSALLFRWRLTGACAIFSPWPGNEKLKASSRASSAGDVSGGRPT